MVRWFRGHTLGADAIGVLAGVATLLAATQWGAARVGDAACPPGVKLSVTSSVERGKASERASEADPDQDPPGVVQRAATGEFSCVTVSPVTSGVAAADLAGDPQAEHPGQDWASGRGPDVWLPSSSIWVQWLAARSSRRPEVLGSVAGSTMELVVQPSVATSLGWSTSVTWDQLRDATASGRLKMIKENALRSTSGAMATLLAFRAAARARTTPLTAEAVAAGDFDDYAGAIERSVTQYPGEIVRFLDDLPAAPGTAPALPAGAQAMILQQALFRQARQVNRGLGQLREIAIAGQEPDLDHPFVLRPGLDATRRALAERFFRHLRAEFEAHPETAFGPAVATLDPDRAVDPEPGRVFDAVLKRWKDSLRQRARLAVLVDQSDSIEDTQAVALHEALRRSLGKLSGTDRASVLGFPSHDGRTVEQLAPPPAASGVLSFGSPPVLAGALPTTGNREHTTPLIEAVTKVAGQLFTAGPPDADNPERHAVLLVTDGEQYSDTEKAELGSQLQQLVALGTVRVYVLLVDPEPTAPARVLRVQPLGAVLGGQVHGPLGATGLVDYLATSTGGEVLCLAEPRRCPAGTVPQKGGDVTARTSTAVDRIAQQLGG